MNSKATWRDPALGTSRELELPQGTLRYFDVGAGPALVFVHGFFVNANVWRKLCARLAPEFRCLMLDLPLGSHATPMRPDADLGERGLVDLVSGAIEALDLDDVTLVGMDTGGAICQFVITQRPERIGRLVLCSCDYRDNFPPAIFSYLKLLPYIKPLVPVLFAPFRLRAPRRLPPAFGWLVAAGAIDRRAEDSYSLPSLVDARIRADAAKACRVFDKRRLNEAADRLGTFEGPALIAWSADDKVFPTAHAHALARDLADARVEWIENSRTFSMEEQPDRLADAIRGFLRDTGAATA